MKTAIFRKYVKTKHFLKRQMEREIDDQLVLAVLMALKKESKNMMVIVSKDVLKQWCGCGIIARSAKEINEELFLILEKNILITCFHGTFGFNRYFKGGHEYYFIQQ